MRHVVIVAFPGVQSLDVAGPLEALAAAGGYAIEVVAPAAGIVQSESGLGLVATRTLHEVAGPIDTLLLAGGEGVRDVVAVPEVIDRIGHLAARSRRVASVCTGAFLLAQAGVLDGRRATTHWQHCALLAALRPTVDVEADAIFVRDEEVWTSAGVTAGIDMALAMIEEDLGPETALRVARQLVVFLKRPGGQAQFSAQLAGQAAHREPLRDLQAWIADHVEEELGVERLASRAAMSPRNFARMFHREVGMTPARYVEQVRVEAARRLLEDTGSGIAEIARRCGFGTDETMRRAFLRSVGVTPTAYRARFAAARRPAQV